MLLAWAKVENLPFSDLWAFFYLQLIDKKTSAERGFSHLRREAFHISAFTNVEICRYLRQLWKRVAFKILTCLNYMDYIRKMWLYYLLKSKAFLANVSFKQPYFKYTALYVNGKIHQVI